MRALPWNERFDAVINWYTAFGYFDDAGNRAVLDSVYRALAPGGRFILDMPNRDMVLRAYQRAAVVEREGNFQIDQSRYDIETGRNHVSRTILRDGRIRRMNFFVRLFTYPELSTWLRQAGFGATAGYDQDGEALALDSQRMLVVAVK
jgi:SAM-dependent methyltransferase